MRHCLFILGACLFALTACSDDSSVESAVDTKAWDLEKNHNYDVSPGDDFYMFCNGSWYGRTDVSGEDPIKGFNAERIKAEEKRMEDLNYPLYENFKAHYDRRDTYKGESLEYLRNRIDKQTAAMKDQKSALLAVAKSMSAASLFEYYPYMSDGKILMGVTVAETLQTLTVGKVRYALEELGYTEGERETILSEYEKLLTLTEGMTVDRNSTRLAGAENPLIEAMAYEFDLIDGYQIQVAGVELFDLVAGFLLRAGVESVKAILTAVMSYDVCFTSTEALDRMEEFDDEEFFWQWESMLDYRTAYMYAGKYVSPELKQSVIQFAGVLKDNFARRLESLAWMDRTTKERALQKLRQMKINVAYPDDWIISSAPEKFSSRLFVENIHEMADEQKALCSYYFYRDVQSYSFNDQVAFGFISNMMAYPVFECNAVVLYPDNLLKPFYNPDATDAYNYATLGMAIARQIVGGFGLEGANYNESGKLENWWTQESKLRYVELQEKLAANRRCLEFSPDMFPTATYDPYATLNDYIIEQGALELVYQAYTEKLRQDGFFGSELVRQEKRFMEAFAETHRSKFDSSVYAQIMGGAYGMALLMSIPGVNGTLMNLDRWYELYDVKPGDKLYLSPERRVHIW